MMPLFFFFDNYAIHLPRFSPLNPTFFNILSGEDFVFFCGLLNA